MNYYVGQTAAADREILYQDIVRFAELSGDFNPVHLDESYAKAQGFPGVIAHGDFSMALISALIATELPGPGTIFLSYDIRFLRPVVAGDRITVQVEIEELWERRRAKLKTTLTNQQGVVVLQGSAVVRLPAEE